MQATLIYNCNARDIDKITPDDIKAGLVEIDYHPVYKATSNQTELNQVLSEIEGGLIVAAGGDGTVRAVATRLVGKKDISLAILPLGTANNITRALNVYRSPAEIIQGLKNPLKAHFDIGYVRAPWGEDYFLEGAGFGMFADILASYDPNLGKSVLRSIQAALETLGEFKSYTPRISIDGKDISDEYLLFEILNTTAIGPRLKFAPKADPGDGLLDVVRIHSDNQESFLNYATGLLTGELEAYDGVEVARASRIEIDWTGFAFHIDGEVRPDQSEHPEDEDPAEGARPHRYGPSTDKTIIIEVMPKSLDLWLPDLRQDS